jgi:hypothetical protein
MLLPNCIRACVVQVVVFAFFAAAQTDMARIAGTIVDTSGGVVAGAKVKVKNEATAVEREATASEQGTFFLPNLSPNLYTISVTSAGFSDAIYQGVRLQVGQERSLNVVLQPASVATEINVSGGELVTVDTSSASLGVNVGERDVANLPLNGRQLSQLYLLTPGAVTSGGGTYDNIRFSGRANQQNIIRQDGIEATSIIDASPGNLNGESSSSFRLQSSLENVQEFRVESNSYPAEYGTGTGGQISIIGKSGSNQFHGALFEYFRNNRMDARNFFDAAKSPLRLNQFGGSIGGPIKKEKLFFFAAIESLRQRAGLNFVETVPSVAARARAVSSIQPLLAAYPIGNTPSANPDLDIATLNASTRVDENYGSVRLDYRMNERHSFYGRYYRDQGESFLPIGVTGNGQSYTAVPQNAVINHQWIVSPSIINEFKVGLNSYKTRSSGFAPSAGGVDVASISVNFTGSVALPGIGGQGSSAGAAVLGGLIRANSAFNGRGQPYTNYSVPMVESLSIIRGNHNLKIGGEFRPIRIYTDRQGGTTYTFSNLNDLLANRPGSITYSGDLSTPSPFNGGQTGERLAKQNYYIGYVQDEWKIRPNITMNYGLRYEYFGVMREERNLAVVFDTVNGVIKPSNTPFYESSKANFGPRLAFTWAPEKFGNKTVFRVGSGIYYGPGQGEDLIQPIESDRISTTLPSGTAFPINVPALIAGYDINSPTLRFQPRAYAPGYRVPERVLSYTASVQQTLPGSAILTVAYVGSQGRNLFLRSITNKITGVSTNPNTGAAIITREFGDRFAEIDYKTSGGRDNYNSLQTTLNRRFSRGLTFGLQHTWAHSIGTSAGSNEARTAANPYDFNADYGNNNFDVRHSMNLTGLYELPAGRGQRWLREGLGSHVLGNWQLGGVWNYRTGLPIEVLITRPDVAYQVNGTNQILNAPLVTNGQVMTTAVINTLGGGASRNLRRPDVVAGVNPYATGGDKKQFLNPAAFAIPQPGTFGNLGRNALHGPSLAQVDLTLQKRFHVSERLNMEFRTEIYNIFNRANFANPSSTLANALGSSATQLQPGQPFTQSTAGGAFGTLNSTVERTVGLGTSRQIQLSLRLNF